VAKKKARVINHTGLVLAETESVVSLSGK
jgi:hypothetical protein